MSIVLMELSFNATSSWLEWQKNIKKQEGIMNDKIVIKGAKEHNLKNISLKIPRDKLVVITGLSGSRKVFFSI